MFWAIDGVGLGTGSLPFPGNWTNRSERRFGAIIVHEKASVYDFKSRGTTSLSIVPFTLYSLRVPFISQKIYLQGSRFI